MKQSCKGDIIRRVRDHLKESPKPLNIHIALDKCIELNKIKHTDFNDDFNQNEATIYHPKQDI